MSETLRDLDPKEMGRRVRVRREEKGLSRETLADKLGVTSQFVADIEHGNKGISIKKLYALCQILDVPADYILAGAFGPEEEDVAGSMAREELMAFLLKCNAEQLKGIGEIAKIYADGVKIK